jgi:hypothetical protein
LNQWSMRQMVVGSVSPRCPRMKEPTRTHDTA